MSNTQAERVEELMTPVLLGGACTSDDVREFRERVTRLVAENDALKADAARLDWLDDNVFSMSMDRLETSRRPTSWKWTFFAPANTQGSIRSILDAARTTTQHQGGQ